jgi:thiol-disulfide isomerase/thioredoxin
VSDLIGRVGWSGAVRLALTLLPLTLVVPKDLCGQDEYAVSLPVGSEAPAAALQDLDGDPVQLLDYMRDRPTLIEFWAIWCENCEALQPQLDRIQESYGDRLNVVAVDPGYPYLWDDRGAAVRAYEVPTTSVVVIVGADGRVAYTGVGPQQDLMAAVEAVLGSTAPDS